MPSRTVRLVLLGLLPLAASCNLLIPTIFIGEHKKSVSAEFDKLENSRTAILVWTDASTLFDYPYARFELATYVRDKLDAEMAGRKLVIDIVDPRDVEDFIQKNVDAQVDPDAVGQAFDTDYVIYLEVLKFQVRDSAQPQFLRGEIHASVAVYDTRADPDKARRYELTPVKCVYPEGAPILMTATNSPLVRQATYYLFAEEVARKFYEHTVGL